MDVKSHLLFFTLVFISGLALIAPSDFLMESRCGNYENLHQIALNGEFIKGVMIFCGLDKFARVRVNTGPVVLVIFGLGGLVSTSVLIAFLKRFYLGTSKVIIILSITLGILTLACLIGLIITSQVILAKNSVFK